MRKYWEQHGVNVTGLSRNGAEIQCDLSTSIPSFDEKFDVVVHSAGLAHVTGDVEKFNNINLEGTLRLLQGLKRNLPKRFILISSVAVYGKETGELIDEKTKCSPSSPYAISKLKAEEAVLNWSKVSNVPVLILRLPLILGHNAPGNLGAMSNALKNRRYFSIGEAKARKSVIESKDVARFILEVPDAFGIYNLTNQDHPTLRDIELLLCSELDVKKPFILPTWFAFTLALTLGNIKGFPLTMEKLKKLTTSLTFSGDLVRNDYNWV
jgi:nucleoside-diphosphate-sugar epimerase